MYADPGPDPEAQINADPCGSGSETLSRSDLFDKKIDIIYEIFNQNDLIHDFLRKS